jgi:hypothetical protein
LISWIESKLIEKYRIPLEGIEKRFIPVFCSFEGILTAILEINNILKDTSEFNTGKIFIDNIV